LGFFLKDLSDPAAPKGISRPAFFQRNSLLSAVRATPRWLRCSDCRTAGKFLAALMIAAFQR
jgi:hypothetical protein